LTGNSLSLLTLFAASSLGEGAFGSTARHLTLPEGVFSVFFIIMLSIAPRGGAVNKAAGKKKKAMEIFHRFAGASCLTRTGDTLINSQVL
jgi:hypothetical protein